MVKISAILIKIIKKVHQEVGLIRIRTKVDERSSIRRRCSVSISRSLVTLLMNVTATVINRGNLMMRLTLHKTKILVQILLCLW